MKRSIIALINTISLFNIAAPARAAVIPENYYAETGLIYAVEWKPENENFIVSFVTQNGNKFSFYSDDGDWFVLDLVSVIFDDNNTPEVFDDIIINYPKYSGYVSLEESKHWIK